MEAVAVAAIISMAPTLTAVAAWRKATRVDANVGQKNGAGPVHEVLGSVLCSLDRIDGRLTRLDARLTRLEAEPRARKRAR